MIYTAKTESLKTQGYCKTEIHMQAVSYFNHFMRWMTFHCAKGYELQVVFMVGATGGGRKAIDHASD
jgi:hypothetical protein